MMSDYSVVEWHAEHEGYRCGYCESPDTNFSHGMTAYKLTVEDYQDLIDRGWRRSGTYVYKPTLKKTCCPQYTIRNDAISFQLSRSQKKVIKRVNKYLNYGIISGKEDAEEEPHSLGACDLPFTTTDAPKAKPESVMESLAKDTGAAPVKQQSPASNTNPAKTHQPKPGVGADPTKPKCKKAKLQRLEKKNMKMAAKATDSSAMQNISVTKGKTLEDYLGDKIKNPAHKLEIRLLRSSPASREFKEMYNESYSVFKKYQTVIHKEDESECSRLSHERFLVESPLQAKNDPLPCGFGSFHQLYILDGKVIAVGVIDILPRCVSSVYFYYDPEYSFLSLGTYSALKELAFTRELHGVCPEICYYYMGFYIHSCPKMRYKGQYNPSFLLCPETYTWHAFEECIKKLNDQKYCRFAEPGVEDKDSTIEVDEILVLHHRQAMPYKLVKKSKDKKSVTLYGNLVGMTLAKRILLYCP